MDEVKMVSDFATRMISKLIKKTILKKTGYAVDIDINSIQFVIDENDVKAHIDAKAKISKNDFETFMNLGDLA